METKSYFIRDLGDGSGTFVHLRKALPLKHGYIISFGDSHMVVQLDLDDIIDNFNNASNSNSMGASKI